MRPAAHCSPLQPIEPEVQEGNKAAGVGWSGLERSGFVTRVTRLRALLKACREAPKNGETERADRILVEAIRVLGKADAEDLRSDE
jgi:hypothetical protein